jgi:hypothetical protein
MLDTDSILHPDNFNESTSDLVASMLESWDNVRRHFDFLQDHVQKVVNKIIRKQNEIHARVEQKRPWANAQYNVVKFDNLGDIIRTHIVDSREVITGEKAPMVTFDINREILKNAHKPEVFEAFFTKYETDLANSVKLKKQADAELAEQLFKIDFEKAKEFYLQHKDHFEGKGE